MAETWNKKEREKKKQQSKKEKEERKQERKENNKGGNSLESMMAYLDENGNLSSTPPDPSRKKVFLQEDIQIGVPKQEFSSEDSFRTGTVSFFNKAKGFGFINEDVSNERIFFHIKDMLEQVEESDKVKFQVERGPRGYSAILLSRNT